VLVRWPIENASQSLLGTFKVCAFISPTLGDDDQGVELVDDLCRREVGGDKEIAEYSRWRAVPIKYSQWRSKLWAGRLIAHSTHCTIMSR
jgi:hypothetical protein